MRRLSEHPGPLTLGRCAPCAGLPGRSPASTALLMALWLALAVSGCAANKAATLRTTPHDALTDRLHLKFHKNEYTPSPRTLQTLRRFDLQDDFEAGSEALLDDLQAFVQKYPGPEAFYAFAELAYIRGKHTEKNDDVAALKYYETAVAHAYLYLFDPNLGQRRNPYDPQFRGACDIYNGALESALRIVRNKGGLLPGHSHTVQVCNQTWNVKIDVKGNSWRPEEFDRFEFVSDYEVNGLANQYHTFGLGVPLIAVRKSGSAAEEHLEKFYPPGLSFPVTALLRVMPQGQSANDLQQNAVLELYDPLQAAVAQVGSQTIPLETDLSTPLAYYLDNDQLADISTKGLLRPDISQEVRGLYMVHPYEPGKIPVIMVHGLWSSPMTWMDMFNDLLGQPEIRENYQFWFYLYPTGQPFWISAAQMRGDLVQVRERLDPQHAEPTLDQMVLVGHSMGGLVSMMQTLESGDHYWSVISDRPFEEIKADETTRQALRNVLFFTPNPSVRRVVTIGTPHRGSKFANDATRYLGRKFISLPQQLMSGQQQIYKDNPGLFKDKTLLNVTTSLDSLAPDSPILPAMLASNRQPQTHYHNIVGVLTSKSVLQRISERGDGIVAFDSAHLDQVDSEIVVDADHSRVHRHPLSVLEVRRILLEHLEMVRNEPAGPAPYRPQPKFTRRMGPSPAPGETAVQPPDTQPPDVAAGPDAPAMAATPAPIGTAAPAPMSAATPALGSRVE